MHVPCRQSIGLVMIASGATPDKVRTGLIPKSQRTLSDGCVTSSSKSGLLGTRPRPHCLAKCILNACNSPKEATLPESIAASTANANDLEDAIETIPTKKNKRQIGRAHV